MVVHQSEDALLLDYTSGALSEGMSLAMATHLSMSPQDAMRYQALNQVGGVLLEGLEPEPLADDEMGLADILTRLDDEPVQPKSVGFDAVTCETVPLPLRNYIPADLDKLKWRKAGPGVEEYALKTSEGAGKASLLRIQPGQAMPQHTHTGRELTVVLKGSYLDGAETFARGDLQLADGQDDHRPIAHEQDGCICLIALDAPVHFTGPVGRFLNPFIRF